MSGRSPLDFTVKPPKDYPSSPDLNLWHCHPSFYMDGERCDCDCGPGSARHPGVMSIEEHRRLAA